MEAEATIREAEESGRRKCPRDNPRVEEKSHSQETRTVRARLHNVMCTAILSYIYLSVSVQSNSI